MAIWIQPVTKVTLATAVLKLLSSMVMWGVGVAILFLGVANQFIVPSYMPLERTVDSSNGRRP
eukprot:475501-Amphidinium_carterae.1